MHLEKAVKAALKLQKKLYSLPVDIQHAEKRYQSFLQSEYTDSIDVGTAEEGFTIKSHLDELQHSEPVLRKELNEQKEIIRPYLLAAEKPLRYPYVVDGLINEEQFLFSVNEAGEVIITEVK